MIVTLMVLGAASAGYILIHQRLPVPWKSTYSLRAEFDDAKSAIGGAGLPVTVSGVQVGTIHKVTLRDGRALIDMAIDPRKLPRVYADARANLVPTTPLKDMEVRLLPGAPPARPLPHGATLPIASTTSPVELDELFAALDADSRDYLTALTSGLGRGTQGRGPDIRRMMRSLRLTTGQVHRLGDAMVGRRRELARLVHNLSLVMAAGRVKDREIAQIVSAGSATLSAVARQDGALRESLTRLPGTITAARKTLPHVAELARLLRPTLTTLTPSVRRLPAALNSLGPLADMATPIVRDRIRPFVRDLQPVARDAAPAVRDLSAQTPDLTGAFRVLQYVANETAYNSPGAWPSFLYWVAWAAHNANSGLSVADAHGSAMSLIAALACGTLGAQPFAGALVQALFNLAPNC